jgi:hypothetical protein
MIEKRPFAPIRWMTLLAGSATMLLVLLSAAHAGSSATLAWDQDPGAAGYRLHYGTSSGNLNQTSEVGSATQGTVSNLTAGQKYFFAVTAYNAAGNESTPSNEVSTTPGASPTPSSTTSSLFKSTDVPATVTVNDHNSVELGVNFQTSTTGQVAAIRFYKGPQNTGSHTGHLWNSAGALLATAVFTNETASGWQQVNLSSPVTLTAGTTYIVSYHSNGFYSANVNYFAGAHSSGPLTAAAGSNGVYAYSSSTIFPKSSYNSTNYWVDVVFVSSSNKTLFNASDTPAIVTANDANPVELGVKFQSTTTTQATGIRFYKGPQNIGTHTAHLWSASGQLLATATFANEAATGWQQADFSSPVTLAAGTTYVVSYHTSGFYSVNENYFATAHSNGSLTALASSASGGNGVYSYGTSSTFPTNNYNAPNYWVDVVAK